MLTLMYRNWLLTVATLMLALLSVLYEWMLVSEAWPLWIRLDYTEYRWSIWDLGNLETTLYFVPQTVPEWSLQSARRSILPLGNTAAMWGCTWSAPVFKQVVHVKIRPISPLGICPVRHMASPALGKWITQVHSSKDKDHKDATARTWSTAWLTGSPGVAVDGRVRFISWAQKMMGKFKEMLAGV